jgi:hypothetical protein
MLARRHWIEALVTTVQGEFLSGRAVKLTVAQAEERFGIDRATSEAILGTLAEANVLTRTHDGGYMRFYPRLAHAA